MAGFVFVLLLVDLRWEIPGTGLYRCAFAESSAALEAGPFHLLLIKGRKAVWLGLQQRPTLPHRAGGRGFCSVCTGLDVPNVLNLRFLYLHVEIVTSVS